MPAAAIRHIRDDVLSINDKTIAKSSKSQLRKIIRERNKRKQFKDMAGLCSLQALVSFTDQSIDKECGGGHFVCYPHLHCNVHWKSVGGTYHVTLSANERGDSAWVPLTNDEIRQLDEHGCKESRVYTNVGNVIIW